jgi:hypothetical protein
VEMRLYIPGDKYLQHLHQLMSYGSILMYSHFYYHIPAVYALAPKAVMGADMKDLSTVF